MRHIPLPHRISHLGSSKQSNGAVGDTSRRSSPSRTTSQSEAKPLILKVYVIKGQNLAAKDKSGTSDPYLVVKLDSARQSTPSISKTLNPEWKICFDIPVVGIPLLECTCWDKDKFGKDYMGEFDIAVEDIFANGHVQQEPQWYALKSKRTRGKKDSQVSGEVQIQFSLVDSANPAASPDEIMQKFRSVIQAEDEVQAESESPDLSLLDSNEDREADEADSGDESELGSVAGTEAGKEKKSKKKKKLARLRRRATIARAYEFSGHESDISGMIFLEIGKVTDLPPERNMTRTSFDMDPFVVTALGRKVLRTKVIRHNLNPIYNEKMVFQVMKHELNYSLTFSVVDRDKLSGNDFVASQLFPIQKIITSAPEADPNTGLYKLPEIQDYTPPAQPPKGRLRLPLSRSSSSQSINKLARPAMKQNDSQLTMTSSYGDMDTDSNRVPPTSAPVGHSLTRQDSDDISPPSDDPGMISYTIPLEMKNKDRWEDKHNPEMVIRARYMPYTALRQQFWRAMLKQYDADESHRISKIELTTLLDTLGSTLHEQTINGFFQRFAQENNNTEEEDLTFDQAVICLEDELERTSKKKSLGTRFKDKTGFGRPSTVSNGETDSKPTRAENSTTASTNTKATRSAVPAIVQTSTGAAGERGEYLEDELADDPNNDDEEHVIEIRECPICHQPKMKKRTDADIITHVATCASSDWRQVNNLVMGGFVTQSQAQRKWYSKVITKISYGGYKLGANSANILVQDRITGQINEERMSVYVRLGIRVLYKALGSREMEKKRIKKMLKSLSIKQGKKYDDPASASQIESFIQFHRLNMSEVLLQVKDYKNFNEFFYRALKPDARPCSAPDRPEIIVSPADCRSVVFNTIDDATRIWVKGRDFSLERLLGDAYPLDAKRYKGGSMGIFRLAPQDYHRFHVPVDGTIGTPKPIEGEYYTVNPMAIRSALDVYGENIRVIVPIDSVAHGRVMFVCIGAMMVGSTVITRKAGEKVKRAEELGYFKFGGSTILLFFEPGKMVWDEDLVDNSSGALETLVRVGMSVGHPPGQEPYKPDMKKKEGDVTMEERQEAKRRIEGSLAPDTGSDLGLEGMHGHNIQ